MSKSGQIMRKQLSPAQQAHTWGFLLREKQVSISAKIHSRTAWRAGTTYRQFQRTLNHTPFFDNVLDGEFFSIAWSSKHRVLRLCIEHYCDKTVRTLTVRGPIVHAIIAAARMGVQDQDIWQILPRDVAKREQHW